MVKQKKHHRVKKQVSSTLFLGNLDEVLHSDEQLLLAEALQNTTSKSNTNAAAPGAGASS